MRYGMMQLHNAHHLLVDHFVIKYCISAKSKPIQKYFRLLILGPDGIESWKKIMVDNLLTHSLYMKNSKIPEKLNSLTGHKGRTKNSDSRGLSHHDRAGNLLIRSFCSYQMSDRERFAQIAQDKWATVRESLNSLISKEQPWANPWGCSWQMSVREWFAQVAHDKWAIELFAQIFFSKILFFSTFYLLFLI